MVNLEDNRSDFKWNGLYTTDTDLKEFLREKQTGGEWDNTQTTAPSSIQVVESTEDSITIRWQPIPFTAGTGGYRIFYREEGKPYDDKTVEEVTGKTIADVFLKGLKKGTKYHLKIHTWTDSHSNNKNRIESPFSMEYSIFTRGIIISGSVKKKDGEGFPGIQISASNGGGTAETDKDGVYRLSVIPGWTGKLTPIKKGYKFSPPSIIYVSEVSSDINVSDYTAESDTVISGTVSFKGKAVDNVTIKFKGSKGDDYSVLTDANGNYQQEVSYGWSGTVNPMKDRHRFDPGERKYQDVAYSLDKQDYEVRLPKIFGRVKMLGGKGVGGVNLKLTEVETDKFNYLKDSVFTDGKGNYEIGVLENWRGKVKPELSQRSKYLLSPPFREIGNLEDTKKTQNFKAMQNFKFFLQITFGLYGVVSNNYENNFSKIFPCGYDITLGYKFLRHLYIWGGIDIIFSRFKSKNLSQPNLLIQQSSSLGIGFYSYDDLLISRKPHWNATIAAGITQLSYMENNVQFRNWGVILLTEIIYNYSHRWFSNLKFNTLLLKGFKVGIGLGYRF